MKRLAASKTMGRAAAMRLSMLDMIIRVNRKRCIGPIGYRSWWLEGRRRDSGNVGNLKAKPEGMVSFVPPLEWVTGGSFCNEINEPTYPLGAERIAATARTAVPGHNRKCWRARQNHKRG
ncbi:MAG: hypothetical protein WBX25_26000 [Rhodomicrobium sp.]